MRNEEPDWVGNRFRSLEGMMDRIKILNEALWREVPKDVISEAEHAAKQTQSGLRVGATGISWRWMGRVIRRSQPEM